MEIPKNIELNKIFTIEKGNRKARWKIIEHPNFDNAFALVKDHLYMKSFDIFDGMSDFEHSIYKKEDYKHIVSGSNTIEKTWQQAYDHT